MKFRLKTYQIALVLLLSVLLPVCLVNALAQTDPLTELCKGHHETRKEFYSQVRFLPPVTIRDLTGSRLEYISTDQGIDLGSLELESGYSVVPVGFKDDHQGCYGIMYCNRHKVVLSIDKLDPKQCGVLKQ